jgi:hypothetical protein
VTDVKLVENSELLADFERHKTLVAQKHGWQEALGGRKNKWAGTHFGFHAMAGGPEELENIYAQGREHGGFDCRLGRQGSYGRGSYFAEHAIYSAYMYPQPARSRDGSITLICAEVVLGKFYDYGSAVDRTLVRPPEGFDSVIGTENGFGFHHDKHNRRHAWEHGRVPNGCEDYGRQWVVYKKEAAYPRYLVTIKPTW